MFIIRNQKSFKRSAKLSRQLRTVYYSKKKIDITALLITKDE